MSTKKSDLFPFPQFDFSQFGESYRAFAEKAIAQSNEAYDKFKAAAEEATANAQTSFEAVRDSFAVLVSKAVENARINTEAGVAFLEKLAAAKTMAEVIDLQAAYFRSTFENLTSQAKEAQELVVKAGEKATAPVKTVVQKAVKAAA
jgi:phasin